MKVIINSHIHNNENLNEINNTINILHKNNIEVYIDENLNIDNNYSINYTSQNDITDVDFIISIGGDGTFLDSATLAYEKSIPILGVNTGRLGFLATTKYENLEIAINNLIKGKFELDERALLDFSANERVFNHNFALNEFSILKRDSSSMITVNAFLNGEFLNTYWADGVIVSTPTGSTGYSLSCGGPLVQPQSENFIITPICPHNLNVRPLIVSDDSVLNFQIEGRSDSYLSSLDSRTKTINSEHIIEIKKYKKKLKIVKFVDYSYLITLREKLNWGIDSRNYKNSFEI